MNTFWFPVSGVLSNEVSAPIHFVCSGDSTLKPERCSSRRERP